MAHLQITGVDSVTPLTDHPSAARVFLLLNQAPDEFDVAASFAAKVDLIEGLAEIEFTCKPDKLEGIVRTLQSALGRISDTADHARITAQETREAFDAEIARLGLET